MAFGSTEGNADWFRTVEPAMSRLRQVGAVIALCAITGVACQGGGASPSPSESIPPGPGKIAGTYLVRNSDGSAIAPLKGEVVAAFRERFLPGTLQTPRPRPVATAATGPDGSFVITGLAPGRYFLATADPTPPFLVVGRWVVLRAEQGASVTLYACRDCPLPA